MIFRTRLVTRKCIKLTDRAFSCLPTIDAYKKKNVEANDVTKKYGKYYPTFYLKTCVHILLDMLGSYLVPDCREFRYLRYMDLNVNKTKPFM